MLQKINRFNRQPVFHDRLRHKSVRARVQVRAMEADTMEYLRGPAAVIADTAHVNVR